MILSIGIGNSNIVIGAYPRPEAGGTEGADFSASPLRAWRLTTVRHRTADETRLLLRELCREMACPPEDFVDAVIVSVVAPLTDVWAQAVQGLLGREPLVVHHRLNLGLTLAVARPEAVGVDRLVDALAGQRRSKGAAIVVDFGTATTFNAVTGDGVFLGGAIAPGLGTVADALTERASALPPVRLVPPPTAIGRDTVPAIQSGLVYGYVGLVEGVLRRIQAELDQPARVLATGGLGHVIAPLTPAIHEYDPWLTLAGAYAVYRLNRPQG